MFKGFQVYFSHKVKHFCRHCQNFQFIFAFAASKLSGACLSCKQTIAFDGLENCLCTTIELHPKCKLTEIKKQIN